MAKLTGKNALICGDSRTIVLTFPFDITGYTVFFTVKPKNDTSSNDDDALIKKTVTSHEDAANGVSHIVLSGTDTRVTAGTYKFDIQVKTPDNNVSSAKPQDIEFVEDITKRTS